MSAIVAAGFSMWRTCRDEFELYREAAFEAAHDACAGQLLNDRGRRRGVSAWSLFIGPEIRALAYASEELAEWWRDHPRITFERFERAWYEGGQR